VKLILSDDFSNKSIGAENLSYCDGKTLCKYLDPWDLNWPSGELYTEGYVTQTEAVDAQFNFKWKGGIGNWEGV
jgi:hypothetical protein